MGVGVGVGVGIAVGVGVGEGVGVGVGVGEGVGVGVGVGEAVGVGVGEGVGVSEGVGVARGDDGLIFTAIPTISVLPPVKLIMKLEVYFLVWQSYSSVLKAARQAIACLSVVCPRDVILSEKSQSAEKRFTLEIPNAPSPHARAMASSFGGATSLANTS